MVAGAIGAAARGASAARTAEGAVAARAAVSRAGLAEEGQAFRRPIRNASGQFAGQEEAQASPSQKEAEAPNMWMSMIKDLAKFTWDLFKDSLKPLKYIWEKMKEASPLLKQQLEILKKSWTLAFRPLGDFLGRIFRPFILYFWRIVMKWYNWWSKIFGTSSATQDPEDVKKALQDEITYRKLLGLDTSDLQAQLDALSKKLQEKSDEISSYDFTPGGGEGGGGGGGEAGETKEPYPGYFKDMSDSERAAAYSKMMWDSLTNPNTKALEEDEPYSGYKTDNEKLRAIQEEIDRLEESKRKRAEETAALIENIRSQKIVTKTFEDSGKAVRDSALANLVAVDNLIAAFSSLTSVVSSATVSTKTKDKSKGGVGGFLATVGSTVAQVLNPALHNPNAPIKAPKKAVGGNIDTTGLYNLHAGERVLTAGDTSRNSIPKSMNMNNYFNISANISNDLDIKKLARRLAELNEVELRRRVSYL